MDTTADHKTLVRSTSDRWLGGVCVGLGRYFDLNPAIYRIAFAVLTLAGGTGALLYIAAWLVIPEEGAADSIAAAELRKHRDHPRRVLGFALLGAIALAVVSSIHIWPSPGNLWVLAALLIAGIAWWRGRVVVGIVLGLLVVLVAGILFAVRVPLLAGIGDRSYDTVHSKYTLGVGELRLNLDQAKLPRGETFVKATVGIGKLRVLVPDNATVDVEGHVQAGDLVLFGEHENGTHVHSHVVDRTGSGRVLVLDLHTGLGKISVERG
jgi:phage shock protein PspC (stress-responsive transcriptional regulator)